MLGGVAAIAANRAGRRARGSVKLFCCLGESLAARTLRANRLGRLKSLILLTSKASSLRVIWHLARASSLWGHRPSPTSPRSNL